MSDPGAAFRKALGAAWFVDDAASLRAAERATFATTQRIVGIARPASTSEVRAAVRVAVATKTSLYPISRGTNWGYGSRVPVETGAVLLDLSRLDRIVDYDGALGVLTVEPGVTFRQAFHFLRARKAPFLLGAIGGSPDSSLLGNALERGIAKGPYGDRAAHVCNLEVVTGRGDVVHTGLGRFPGAKAAPLHRWGVGPSLDGLFMQSRFGIVTRMSQWLSARPEHFQVLFHAVPDDRDLPRVIDALQALLRRGVLRPTLTLYNDHRVIASTKRYPWDRTGGATPLPDGERTRLREELGLRGTWGGDLAIYAPDRAIGRETARCVRQALGDVVAFGDALEADADEIDAWLEQAASRPATPDSAEGLRRALFLNFLGVPSDDAVRTVYWRKPAGPPGAPDPDRDGVGLLWCSPVVPFRGADVERALRLMHDCMTSHSFEPGLTIQCMTERVVYLVASIAFDRDAPGEDARALACHRAMEDALLRAGYPLYRSSIASMADDRARPPGGDTAAALRAIGEALDPFGVVAPGRYVD